MSDDCIERLKGFHDKDGYPLIWHEGRNWRGNRLTWTKANGPIPKGMQVLHTCDNPACINPDHLWLGTEADNMRDKTEKGRNWIARGEDHHCAKLDRQKVEWMRSQRAEGVKLKDLAAYYGVSIMTVSNVCRPGYTGHGAWR